MIINDRFFIRGLVLALSMVTSFSVVQADSPTTENPTLNADAALRGAQAALEDAQEKKIDAAVAVVDSSGRLLVFPRAAHLGGSNRRSDRGGGIKSWCRR